MKVEPDELDYRARLGLVLIVEHIDDRKNVLHQAPQHSLLLDMINEALPPRFSRGKIMPVLTSKEQTSQLANRLRMAGLLVSAPGMQFNMVPTDTGRKYAARWKREVRAWMKSEWWAWQEHGQKEAIRRSRGALERSVA